MKICPRSGASTLLLALLLLLPAAVRSQASAEALSRSVRELRNAIGEWDVVTQLLNEDGSVATTMQGSYEFSWVVPDRVAIGRSSQPDLQRSAGILFFINESRGTIEMVTVAADGYLWTMSGPLGGDERRTQEFATTDGGTGQLRFTRFNATADAFESRMEYTEDGGTTWTPGNHQVFRRRTA